MSILKREDCPLWYLLSFHAVQKEKNEKIRLLKEAISYKPTQSWPYIELLKEIESLEEKINLAVQAIKLDNNIWAYFIVYQIMKSLNCHKILKREIEKIKNKKKQEVNFAVLLQNIDEEKNENIELFSEFLKVSDINKNDGLISLKDSTSPEQIKRTLKYDIINGKIKIDQEKILKFHPNEILFITYPHTDILHTIDFIIKDNNLILGYEHGYIANESSFVQAAGRFFIDEDGCLIVVDNWSGHYRPKKEELFGVEEFLKKQRIDTFYTHFNFELYK